LDRRATWGLGHMVRVGFCYQVNKYLSVGVCESFLNEVTDAGLQLFNRRLESYMLDLLKQCVCWLAAKTIVSKNIELVGKFHQILSRINRTFLAPNPMG
jgi:hypothetical protein